MSKKNKNSKPSLATNKLDDTFDVRKNLKKLRKGKTSYNDTQTQADLIETEVSSNITSIKSDENFSESYGSTFTESIYSRYDKLKDDLNTEVGSLKDTINNQGTDIRKDLNDKFQQLIEKKISIDTFWKIIGALVGAVILISTLIYQLSYSDIIETVDINSDNIGYQIENSERLNEIDKELVKQNKELERLDSIQKKQNQKLIQEQKK